MDKITTIIKGNVRIFASDLTETAKTAIEKHNTKPLPSLILARGVATLGPLNSIRTKGITSAHIKTPGPIKSLIVESNSEGTIRALIGDPNIATDFDDKDINLIPVEVGLSGTKENPGKLKVTNTYKNENFGGEVDLFKGDIVTDLAFYFDQSEQIQSAVFASTKFNKDNQLISAFSVIYHLLPSHTEEDIEWVEEFSKNNDLHQASSIDEYISKINGKKMLEKDYTWKCNCSDQKFKDIIRTIPINEQEELIKENGFVEVRCNFCRTLFKETSVVQ